MDGRLQAREDALKKLVTFVKTGRETGAEMGDVVNRGMSVAKRQQNCVESITKVNKTNQAKDKNLQEGLDKVRNSNKIDTEALLKGVKTLDQSVFEHLLLTILGKDRNLDRVRDISTGHKAALLNAEKDLLESRLNEQIGGLQTQVTALGQEASGLNTQLQAIQTSRDHYKDRYEIRGKANNGLQKANDALEEKNHDLLERRSRLQTAYDNVVAEKDSLQIVKDGLKTEKVALQDQCNTFKGQCNTLQAEKDGLQAEKVALQGQYNTLQIEKDRLKTEKAAFQDQCNTLRGQHDTLQGQYNTLQGQHNTLQGQCDTLKRDKERVMKERDESESKSLGLITNLKEATDTCSTLTKDCATLKSSRDEMEQELQVANGSIASMWTVISEATAERDSTTKSLTEAENEVTKLQCKLNDSLQVKGHEIAELRDQLTNSRRVKDEEVSELTASLKAKDEEVLNLTGSLQARDSEIDGLQKQLADSRKAKDEDVANLTASLQAKDEEVAKLQDKLTGTLQTRGEELVKLQKELTEKQEALEALDQSHTNLKQSLIYEKDNVQKKETRISELDGKVESLTLTSNQQAVSLKDLNEELTTVQTELEREKQRYSDLETNLQAAEARTKEQELAAARFFATARGSILADELWVPFVHAANNAGWIYDTLLSEEELPWVMLPPWEAEDNQLATHMSYGLFDLLLHLYEKGLTIGYDVETMSLVHLLTNHLTDCETIPYTIVALVLERLLLNIEQSQSNGEHGEQFCLLLLAFGIWQTSCVLERRWKQVSDLKPRVESLLRASGTGITALYNLLRGDNGQGLLAELFASRDPDGDPAQDDQRVYFSPSQNIGIIRLDKSIYVWVLDTRSRAIRAVHCDRAEFCSLISSYKVRGNSAMEALIFPVQHRYDFFWMRRNMREQS